MRSRVVMLCGVVTAVAACGDGKAVELDAAVDAPTMCPTQVAMPLAPGRRTIFLNFDGVTLTKGVDDAPNNVSSIVPTTTTIPPYQASNPVRQGRIDIIVGAVQRTLAPYSVDIVTSRPAEGPYHMCVIGGLPDLIVYPSDFVSVAPQDCSGTGTNLVSLEFDQDNPAIRVANFILGDIGLMSGLGGSMQQDDCMNQYNNYSADHVCSFGAMTTTTEELPFFTNCGYTPTQDEPRLLAQAFGCR